jgi:hypothetical protein
MTVGVLAEALAVDAKELLVSSVYIWTEEGAMKRRRRSAAKSDIETKKSLTLLPDFMRHLSAASELPPGCLLTIPAAVAPSYASMPSLFVGRRAEVFFSDVRQWYRATIDAARRETGGGVSCHFAFDDGDEEWTRMPDVGVRLLTGDFATAPLAALEEWERSQRSERSESEAEYSISSLSGDDVDVAAATEQAAVTNVNAEEAKQGSERSRLVVEEAAAGTAKAPAANVVAGLDSESDDDDSSSDSDSSSGSDSDLNSGVARDDAERGLWTCALCTLVNATNGRQCDACGARRTRASVLGKTQRRQQERAGSAADTVPKQKKVPRLEKSPTATSEPKSAVRIRKPPGRVPKDAAGKKKVWDHSEGVWVSSDANGDGWNAAAASQDSVKKPRAYVEDGKRYFRRPAGRPPRGMVWSKQHGAWQPNAESDASFNDSTTDEEKRAEKAEVEDRQEHTDPSEENTSEGSDDCACVDVVAGDNFLLHRRARWVKGVFLAPLPRDRDATPARIVGDFPAIDARRANRAWSALSHPIGADPAMLPSGLVGRVLGTFVDRETGATLVRFEAFWLPEELPGGRNPARHGAREIFAPSRSSGVPVREMFARRGAIRSKCNVLVLGRSGLMATPKVDVAVFAQPRQHWGHQLVGRDVAVRTAAARRWLWGGAAPNRALGAGAGAAPVPPDAGLSWGWIFARVEAYAPLPEPLEPQRHARPAPPGANAQQLYHRLRCTDGSGMFWLRLGRKNAVTLPRRDVGAACVPWFCCARTYAAETDTFTPVIEREIQELLEGGDAEASKAKGRSAAARAKRVVAAANVLAAAAKQRAAHALRSAPTSATPAAPVHCHACRDAAVTELGERVDPAVDAWRRCTDCSRVFCLRCLYGLHVVHRAEARSRSGAPHAAGRVRGSGNESERESENDGGAWWKGPFLITSGEAFTARFDLPRAARYEAVGEVWIGLFAVGGQDGDFGQRWHLLSDAAASATPWARGAKRSAGVASAAGAAFVLQWDGRRTPHFTGVYEMRMMVPTLTRTGGIFDRSIACSTPIVVRAEGGWTETRASDALRIAAAATVPMNTALVGSSLEDDNARILAQRYEVDANALVRLNGAEHVQLNLKRKMHRDTILTLPLRGFVPCKAARACSLCNAHSEPCNDVLDASQYVAWPAVVPSGSLVVVPPPVSAMSRRAEREKRNARHAAKKRERKAEKKKAKADEKKAQAAAAAPPALDADLVLARKLQAEILGLRVHTDRAKEKEEEASDSGDLSDFDSSAACGAPTDVEDEKAEAAWVCPCCCGWCDCIACTGAAAQYVAQASAQAVARDGAKADAAPTRCECCGFRGAHVENGGSAVELPEQCRPSLGLSLRDWSVLGHQLYAEEHAASAPASTSTSSSAPPPLASAPEQRRSLRLRQPEPPMTTCAACEATAHRRCRSLVAIGAEAVGRSVLLRVDDGDDDADADAGAGARVVALIVAFSPSRSLHCVRVDGARGKGAVGRRQDAWVRLRCANRRFDVVGTVNGSVLNASLAARTGSWVWLSRGFVDSAATRIEVSVAPSPNGASGAAAGTTPPSVSPGKRGSGDSNVQAVLHSNAAERVEREWCWACQVSSGTLSTGGGGAGTAAGAGKGRRAKKSSETEEDREWIFSAKHGEWFSASGAAGRAEVSLSSESSALLDALQRGLIACDAAAPVAFAPPMALLSTLLDVHQVDFSASPLRSPPAPPSSAPSTKGAASAGARLTRERAQASAAASKREARMKREAREAAQAAAKVAVAAKRTKHAVSAASTAKAARRVKSTKAVSFPLFTVHFTRVLLTVRLAPPIHL